MVPKYPYCVVVVVICSVSTAVVKLSQTKASRRLVRDLRFFVDAFENAHFGAKPFLECMGAACTCLVQ